MQNGAALPLLVVHARTLIETLADFNDWPELLRRMGIDPEARSGAG